LAIVVAAVSTFIIGAIWYGPLFGKIWMNEMGFTEEDLKQANMVKIYGIAFVLEFIIALNLAMFFFGGADPCMNDCPGITTGQGAFYGFLTGFGWVAMAMGVNALFNRSSFRRWAIDAFYFVVTFTVMGTILAAWQ
jgi:hypothetical protein